MAGIFEVFLDADSLFRFRLKAPDGTVMAVSGAFGDKPAVAAGIAAVRECAGTGLVTDLSAAASRPAHRRLHPFRPGQPAVPSAAAEPAWDRQQVPVSRVRAFAHFNAVRSSVRELFKVFCDSA